MFLERFFKGSRLFLAPVNLRILVLSGGILEQFLWLSGLLFWQFGLFDDSLVCHLAVRLVLCLFGLSSGCKVFLMLDWFGKLLFSLLSLVCQVTVYSLVSFMWVMLLSGFIYVRFVWFSIVTSGLGVKGGHPESLIWFDLSMCCQVC